MTRSSITQRTGWYFARTRSCCPSCRTNSGLARPISITGPLFLLGSSTVLPRRNTGRRQLARALNRMCKRLTPTRAYDVSPACFRRIFWSHAPPDSGSGEVDYRRKSAAETAQRTHLRCRRGGMSDAIRSVSAISTRDYLWIEHPSDRKDFRENVVSGTDDGSVCRDPTTLRGAVIWGDQTAVSNAYRCATPHTVDDFICDDRKLGPENLFRSRRLCPTNCDRNGSLAASTARKANSRHCRLAPRTYFETLGPIAIRKSIV